MVEYIHPKPSRTWQKREPIVTEELYLILGDDQVLVEQRRWYNDELGWNPTQLPPFSVMVAGIVDHDLPRHPVTRARRTIVNPVPKADRLALEGMIQERGLKGPISYYTDRVLFN